jgi:hypothetical protein
VCHGACGPRRPGPRYQPDGPRILPSAPTVLGPSDPVPKRRAVPSIRANRPSWGRSVPAGSIWGYASDCYSETDSVAKREPHMRSPLLTFDQDDSLVIDRKARRG